MSACGRSPGAAIRSRRRPLRTIPKELSPRRSFAQWHQVVEGTSDPWTAARPLRGAAHRRERHRRRHAVSRGAGPDRAGPTRSGPSPGSRFRPADRRRGRSRLDPRMQCRVQRAARRRSRRVAAARGLAELLCRSGQGATEAEGAPHSETAVARRGDRRGRARRNEARACAGGRGLRCAGTGAGFCPAVRGPD